MSVSKAQQKSVAKYESKVYDKILVRVPKGHRDDIQAHASEAGQSVNGYVVQAVDERIEREKEEN
jgi:predicted HicB family RNase H-like nuclease